MFEPSSFVHLDVRSNFSLKDGAFFPEELAVRAAELGMPAVALTDRDGLYGVARFVEQCAKAGVKPILGATLTLATQSSIVVLAEDATGYANLCRLITDAHMTGERGDPSLVPTQVLAHAEGLICLLGPRSTFGALAAKGLHDAARDALEPWRDAFGGRLFVEVQHRMEEDSNREIRRVLRLADETHTPAVATNAVRYLVPEDAFLADALECMREIVPVAQHHLTRTNAEGYLKPAEEMRRLFAERSELCDATLAIAERCRFDLDLHSVHFPDFPTPAGRSAASVLAERCWHGMERRGMKPTREVRDRLDLELAMIQKLGYAAYFLTVAEIVEDIRAMGIRTACRGSAAGSLVCHLTGISDVDPIRHGLIFERFINPLRDELPDIDIDVESARREDVYDMVLSRHGEDRCACVCMVETYRARAAVREVGKALGLPDTEIDTVAKAFPHIGAHHIREAIDRLPELKGSNLDRGHLESLFRVAERLNGFPRHLALHPSAIAMAGHDLVERVPLERSFRGYRMIQADKDDVELLGYLKLDVLGVRLLSSMRHAVDEIARTAHEKVDLDDLPIDDPATLDLIRSSDTLGCFQIESPGQRELLQKLQPDRWEDLVVEISLFRPGPVKSDMVTPYVNRRHGYQPVTYAHPDLRPVLQETFGVIVYHEQVMRTFAVMGGYDMSEADRIRRHLDADPFEVGEIRADFLERAQARGLSKEEADRIWHALFQFASFGFCKAHAAAFAVPTYQSSWLKAHWPAHFLAGVLTHEPGMYPRRLILDDARRHGIPILPLDVNLSEPEYTVEIIDDSSERGGAVSSGRAFRLAARSLSEGEPRVAPSPPATRLPPLFELPRDASPPLEEPPFGEPPLRASMTPVLDNGSGRAGRGSAQASSRSPDARADRSQAQRSESRAGTGPRPQRAQTEAYGIRLALKDVHGISDQEVRQILEARADRPFRDVDDFLRRTSVSRPVVEAIAHTGGFDSLPRGTRRDRLYRAMTARADREGEQLVLTFDASERPPGLREYTDAERVRAELEVLDVDASRHLMSFYEPLLRELGVTRASDLSGVRSDAWVTVAGVKVASQTPAVKSGQRIIFLTLDDATGPVDVTVFEKVQDRCAQTVFHSFLLAVRGRVRRTGVRGVSIIAEEAYDLVALQRARTRDTPPPDAGSPPRKLWHASGGSAGW